MRLSRGGLMRFADLIIAEIMTPTGQTGPLGGAYLRAVSGIGHALFGAAFFAPLGLLGLGAPMIVRAAIVALIYWLAKERGDLRRGGDVWDGIEDAICVSLGAWYGAIWWPVAVLVSAGIILGSAAWRART